MSLPTVVSTRLLSSTIRRALVLALASTVLGLLPFTLTDCATAHAPVQSTIQVPTLHVHDQAEVTRDGITIQLATLTPDTYQRFPQAHRRVNWSVRRGNDSVPGTADVNILPFPNFQIRIANHTGHVIRFTQTVFRLQDNLGRTYPLFTGTPEVVAWNEGVWGTIAAQAPEVLPQVLPGVRAAVGQLQLLTRSTELLNGDEWSGYLAFNVGVNTNDEYLALMNSVSRFTLRLAEIPVDVNEAGTPTRTTEFTFALDRAEGSLAATCPDGVAPSLSTCSW